MILAKVCKVFFIAVATYASYFEEKKIHAAVLDGYDATVRPSVSNGTLDVFFQLKIQKIVKFVRKCFFFLLTSAGFLNSVFRSVLHETSSTVMVNVE